MATRAKEYNMKVKELIQQLSQLNQELDVYVRASDGDDLDYINKLHKVGEAFLDEETLYCVRLDLCNAYPSKKGEKIVALLS